MAFADDAYGRALEILVEVQNVAPDYFRFYLQRLFGEFVFDVSEEIVLLVSHTCSDACFL